MTDYEKQVYFDYYYVLLEQSLQEKNFVRAFSVTKIIIENIKSGSYDDATQHICYLIDFICNNEDLPDTLYDLIMNFIKRDVKALRYYLQKMNLNDEDYIAAQEIIYPNLSRDFKEIIDFKYHCVNIPKVKKMLWDKTDINNTYLNFQIFNVLEIRTRFMISYKKFVNRQDVDEVLYFINTSLEYNDQELDCYRKYLLIHFFKFLNKLERNALIEHLIKTNSCFDKDVYDSFTEKEKDYIDSIKIVNIMSNNF